MSKCIPVLAIAAFVAAWAVAASGQEAQPRAEPAPGGRYQAVYCHFDPWEGRIFVIDTATGQCWSRAKDGEWQDEGNPTRSKARRTSRAADVKPVVPTLKLESKSVDLTIIQREERAIPGSDGTVRIRLGDITEGQVLLTVVTSGNKLLLDTTSVSQGDKVAFSVGAQRYTLELKELRNVLIGDDFAKIVVEEATPKRASEKSRSPDEKK